jgi:hypothetical protein
LSDRERKSKAPDAAPADGYTTKAAELSGIRHNYMQELAKELATELNAKIQAMPKDSYEDKKAIARFVNEQCRRFDVAVRCPRTGEPSTLVAAPTGNHPAGYPLEPGRFATQHRKADGKARRPVSWVALPELELMEARPRREAILEWSQRVAQQTAEERSR